MVITSVSAHFSNLLRVEQKLIVVAAFVALGTWASVFAARGLSSCGARP